MACSESVRVEVEMYLSGLEANLSELEVNLSWLEVYL
jgi:hypothetical protein